MTSVKSPILSLLFWNMSGKHRVELLASLCREHEVDLVAIAEPPQEGIELTLQSCQEFLSQFSRVECDGRQRLLLFHRSSTALQPRVFFVYASNRLVMAEFVWNQQPFILAAVHLTSPLRADLEERNGRAINIARRIRAQEDSKSNTKTILIGDLNLNPFDRAVAQADGFHGMMTKASTAKRYRTVQEEEYRYFYNPMWGSFGDRTDGPPGTYHYTQSDLVAYDWHIFDQVLLRPEVLDLAKEDIKILGACSGVNLLGNRGKPDQNVGSDHLPILLTLHWKA